MKINTVSLAALYDLPELELLHLYAVRAGWKIVSGPLDGPRRYIANLQNKDVPELCYVGGRNPYFVILSSDYLPDNGINLSEFNPLKDTQVSMGQLLALINRHELSIEFGKKITVGSTEITMTDNLGKDVLIACILKMDLENTDG